MNRLFRLTSYTLSNIPKFAVREFHSRTDFTARTIICCNSVLNPTRSLHVTPLRLEDEPKKSRYDGLLERDPSRDRSRKISVETSIRYVNSQAFKDGYGNDPVWFLYRRNHKYQFAPPKTRKMCIRNDVIMTGNPCPICRDEFLVVSYKNVELLKQFISPITGELLSYKTTGVCQQQHQNLLVAYLQARDLGLITFDLPFREYDYSEYELK